MDNGFVTARTRLAERSEMTAGGAGKQRTLYPTHISINNKKYFPDRTLPIEETDGESARAEEAEVEPQPPSPKPQARERSTSKKQRIRREARERAEARDERERQEDRRWLEISADLRRKREEGRKEATTRQKSARVEQTKHQRFEWESDEQESGSEFDEILSKFGSETEQLPSSTPYPKKRTAQVIQAHVASVNADKEQPSPSFWDKGKWNAVDPNEGRGARDGKKGGASAPEPSRTKSNEKPWERTKADASRRARNQSETEEESRKAKKQKARRKRGSSERGPTSKGLKFSDLTSKTRAREERERGRRSETPKYLGGGYMAAHFSMREDKDGESDEECITSDDDAGERKKRQGSSSSSSASFSSSSSSPSSSNSSGSSSSGSSDTARERDEETSDHRRKRNRHKRESQKKAQRKYKKELRRVKSKLRKQNGHKASTPTAFSGKPNWDVFEQWAFECDNWRKDMGYSKCKVVRHIGNFLTGEASRWFMTEVLTQLSAYDLPKLFKSLFEHCFPYNYKATLREHFQSATQGKRGVREYLRELRMMQKRLEDVSEQQLRQRFWDGTELYLRLKWTEAGLNPEDSETSKLERAALRFERAEAIRRSEAKKSDRVNLTRTDRD
ncbi:hypothetical protein FRC10_006494, partial [Ceratobasidium sp. 414]